LVVVSVPLVAIFHGQSAREEISPTAKFTQRSIVGAVVEVSLPERTWTSFSIVARDRDICYILIPHPGGG
jgi:hypothetical protein